jgi:hypothetical protein
MKNDSSSDDIQPLSQPRDDAGDLSQSVKSLWRKFNVTANELSIALGRTKNIVGEYAEHLANLYYQGTLLKVSGASADIEMPDGTRYQVKSRKISGSPTTQLNVIRSWDFDFLVVILFDEIGDVYRAIELPMLVAREYAKESARQGGGIITTSRVFLCDTRGKDITKALSKLNAN